MKFAPNRLAAPVMAAVLILGLIGPGCGGRRQGMTPVEAVSDRISVDSSLASDPAVETLIEPYRKVFQARMGEELAYCPGTFRTGRPEGNMGALVADILLERARAESGEPVDVGITNNGGLRISWSRGVINLGQVYELMPFDNEIVLLRFDTRQMRRLAEEIAENGGEPISGMELIVQGDRLQEVRVGGEPLENRDYWVATNDYLAGGGGGISILWDALELRKTGVLLREAIADAVREFGQSGGGPEGLGVIPEPEMNRIREASTGMLWCRVREASTGMLWYRVREASTGMLWCRVREASTAMHGDPVLARVTEEECS